MNRLIALALVVLAAPAFAANPDWVVANTSLECQAKLEEDESCSFQWTTSANANSDFMETRGLAFSLRLEPQRSGTDTAATADVYACTSKDGNDDGTPDTTACSALNWDTDGDGVVDDNTLDGTSAMKIGTPVFMGIPYIYIDPATNPASGTAEVVITGERVK